MGDRLVGQLQIKLAVVLNDSRESALEKIFQFGQQGNWIFQWRIRRGTQGEERGQDQTPERD
jgi:hypothetical protein